jgi:hypothetical protein
MVIERREFVLMHTDSSVKIVGGDRGEKGQALLMRVKR